MKVPSLSSLLGCCRSIFSRSSSRSGFPNLPIQEYIPVPFLTHSRYVTKVGQHSFMYYLDYAQLDTRLFLCLWVKHVGFFAAQTSRILTASSCARLLTSKFLHYKVRWNDGLHQGLVQHGLYTFTNVLRHPYVAIEVPAADPTLISMSLPLGTSLEIVPPRYTKSSVWRGSFPPRCALSRWLSLAIHSTSVLLILSPNLELTSSILLRRHCTWYSHSASGAMSSAKQRFVTTVPDKLCIIWYHLWRVFHIGQYTVSSSVEVELYTMQSRRQLKVKANKHQTPAGCC